MSSLAWKIKRLKAMGAGEIALRIKRIIRQRIAKPPYLKETPEATFNRLFPTLAGRDAVKHLAEREKPHFFELNPAALESIAPGILSEAEAILNGKVEYWGKTIQLDDPPVWNKNYFDGSEWPTISASAIDYHKINIAGGVKYTWEPSRHAFLLKLAQAYFISGDERFGDKCIKWWSDWLDNNPVNVGIHWTSPLEMAVRVFTWNWMLRLLKAHPKMQSDTLVRRILGHMAQQVSYIADNLSLGSSANNHLIGEAAAVCFFSKLYPECIRSSKWVVLCRPILEQEIERQIHSDGVTAEQAFGYLPFVWEFYLFTYGLMKLNGEAIPEIVRQRLNASLDFIRAVMDEKGYVFQVGDEDEGEVVPFYAKPHNRYCAVGRAVATLIEAELLPKCYDQDDAYCLSLFMKLPELVLGAGSLAHESQTFDEGGYVVMRSSKPERVVLLDCGPLGLGSIAAHGHADALQICLSVDGVPILIDSGTYAYHEDPKWRDYFRSTPAHNTVSIDDASQSEILGPFLWGRRVSAGLDLFESNVDFDYAHASYITRETAVVTRRVIFLKPDLLLINDRLTGISDPANINFNFASNCKLLFDEESGQWNADQVSIIGVLFDKSIDTPQVLTAELKEEWYSPNFGQKVPCSRLVYPYQGSDIAEQWIAISADSTTRVIPQPYGFSVGEHFQIILTEASPWEANSLVLAVQSDSSGNPTAICGVDIAEVKYGGRVLFQSDVPQTFGWRTL